MNRAQTGQRGEAAAAKFYLDRGCRLLTHNFHTRMGELDVVVQEPDGTIVICEVKTRRRLPDHPGRGGEPGKTAPPDPCRRGLFAAHGSERGTRPF